MADFVFCSGARSIGAGNVTGLLSFLVTVGCAVTAAWGSFRISTVMLCSVGGGGDFLVGKNPTAKTAIKCSVTEIARLGAFALGTYRPFFSSIGKAIALMVVGLDQPQID